jgi:hypothetical protein
LNAAVEAKKNNGQERSPRKDGTKEGIERLSRAVRDEKEDMSLHRLRIRKLVLEEARHGMGFSTTPSTYIVY